MTEKKARVEDALNATRGDAARSLLLFKMRRPS
jgi:hypothetical protein